MTSRNNAADTRGAELNREGLNYYKEGNLQAALMRFTDAAKANPEEPEYPNNAGICYLNMGEFEKAALSFQKAIHLRPDLALYHYNLGLAHMNLARTNEAAAEFKKATDLDRNSFESWYYLGLASFQKNDLPAARKAWLTAGKLRQNSDVENNLGMIDMNEGAFDRAKDQFQKAIRLDPNHYMANYNLGVLYHQKLGKPGEAIPYYKRAISLSPMAYAPQLNIALAYESLGQKQQAIEHLEKFLQLAPPGLDEPVRDAREKLKKLKAR